MTHDPKLDLVDPETGEILNHKGRRLDIAGREIPDPVSLPPPPGYKRQPTLAETIRQMVRSEQLAQEAARMDKENFDEADDFEVGEDYDPKSPYEGDFDPIDIDRIRAGIDLHRAGIVSEADGRPPPKGPADTPSSPAKTEPSPEANQ